MLKVTCALIIQNNKVLITQNNAQSDHPFQWEFPGGKIKNYETEEDCILREIKEELELEIGILTKINSLEFDYGIKQIELIPFICSIKKGEIKLNEHHAFRWVEIDELNGVNFSAADKKLIDDKENRRILKKHFRK